MDHVEALPHAWFLCLQYVTFLFNSMYLPQIKSTPAFALSGSINDNSMLLTSTFGSLFILGMESLMGFNLSPKRAAVIFVGFAKHVGHVMTFKVLADDSQKVFFHSTICFSIEPGKQNLQVNPFSGELPTFVKFSQDPVTQMPFDPGSQDSASPPTNEEEIKSSQLPMFHPSDLGCWLHLSYCTFLLDHQEDGQMVFTCIVQATEEHNAQLHSNGEQW